MRRTRAGRSRLLELAWLTAAAVLWPAPARAQSELHVDAFGAVGDGVADDTAAIQAALDAAAPGSSVIFTPGRRYRVGNAASGLAPRSGTRLVLHGATLSMGNSTGQRGRILTLAGKDRVTLSGGTLLGSRAGTPEWGIGVHVSDSSDILLEDVTLRDFYTDAVTVTGDAGSQRVTIRRCRTANAGRNGISLISGLDITVEDSAFETTSNADANMPRAGLAAEPNAGNSLRHVRISRCRFRDNQGSGLLLQLGAGALLSHLTVSDNVAEGNGGSGIVLSAVSHVVVARNRVSAHGSRNGYGIGVVRGGDNIVIRANVLEGNRRSILVEGVTGASIQGNTIVGTGPGASPRDGDDGDGIRLRGHTTLVDGQPRLVPSAHAVIAGNLIRDVAGRGVLLEQVRHVSVANNVVVGSGQEGSRIQFGSEDSRIVGNIVAGNGREDAGRYPALFLSHASSRTLMAHNQVREGERTFAGVALDNVSDSLVSQNCFLAGPGTPLAISDNALRTAYNWRFAGVGWNRAVAAGLVQFVPPAPDTIAGARNAWLVKRGKTARQAQSGADSTVDTPSRSGRLHARDGASRSRLRAAWPAGSLLIDLARDTLAWLDRIGRLLLGDAAKPLFDELRRAIGWDRVPDEHDG